MRNERFELKFNLASMLGEERACIFGHKDGGREKGSNSKQSKLIHFSL